MLPSLENPVEQVLAAVEQLPPVAQQTLVASILAQFGPNRPRPSAKAQERLDRIVAHLLPPMPIGKRVEFARAFGALDLDLPRTLSAIDGDVELIAEISLGHAAPEPDAIRNLGRQRRFIDTRIMAGREDLTTEAAEALAEAGDARTVRTLANNGYVTFSSKTMSRLVTRASHDEALQRRLCARPELGTEDAHRLAVVVPDSLKSALFERLDRETVAEVQRRASAAIPAKIRQMRLHRDAAESAQAVHLQVRTGRKSLAEALTVFAATDQVIAAVELLGASLGLDREKLILALGRRRLEPFEALCRAVALDENIFVPLVAALCRRWRQPAPDPRGLTRRYRALSEEQIDAELARLHRFSRRAAGASPPPPGAGTPVMIG